VRHRQVLADDAAELDGDVVHGLLVHGPRGLRVDRGRGWANQRQRRQDPDQDHRTTSHGEAVSASSRSTVARKTSSVTAPTCLSRIFPCRSRKKVSGTPYTP